MADWDECYKTIVKIIEEKKPVKSRDLSRQIVLFSYFTERAAEAGLVGKLNSIFNCNIDVDDIHLELEFINQLNSHLTHG